MMIWHPFSHCVVCSEIVFSGYDFVFENITTLYLKSTDWVNVENTSFKKEIYRFSAAKLYCGLGDADIKELIDSLNNEALLAFLGRSGSERRQLLLKFLNRNLLLI